MDNFVRNTTTSVPTDDFVTATTTTGIAYTYEYRTQRSLFEERVEKYMMCDKRTLAEMLALRDEEEKETSTPTYEYGISLSRGAGEPVPTDNSTISCSCRDKEKEGISVTHIGNRWDTPESKSYTFRCNDSEGRKNKYK